VVRKFEYFEPNTVEEVISLFKRYRSKAMIMAGGTNLIPELRAGRINPDYVVNIKTVEGLDRVDEDSRGIHIGALVTQADLSLIEITNRRVANPSLLGRIPKWFRKIISLMGNPQVRNMASVAGNLAWASPAADAAPPLLALDAELELHGSEGKRILPIDQFFLGPGKTALNPNEMITEIVIPASSLDKVGMAEKFMKRKANTLSVCSAAVSFNKSDRGVFDDVRIAVGAVAPVPLRIKKAETLLEGERLEGTVLREIKDIVSREIRPITDGRATAWFRKEVTPVLVERCIMEAVG
jgi:carbon-monoxide dehydrogenase medium subunit